MCVNNLSKVALDSAAAGFEPAISSRKSNALSTTPPSHTMSIGDGFGHRSGRNGEFCVAVGPVTKIAGNRDGPHGLCLNLFLFLMLETVGHCPSAKVCRSYVLELHRIQGIGLCYNYN